MVPPATEHLSLARTAAYGALGLPLAFAALPVYVHVPKLYAGDLGLPLATVGLVLLATRVVDAVTDPLLGWLSDRLPGRRLMIGAALPLLALGVPGLLAPPPQAGPLWLASLLVLVTLGYSMASVAYLAWGAEVASSPHGRTRAVAAREAFSLAGVVLAASLPGLLAGDGDPAFGFAVLGWVFPPLLAVAAACTLAFTPARPPTARGAPAAHFGALGAALRHAPFAHLLAAFAASGIAAAIPSATVLFFVADVLQAEAMSGLFLALYFVAAAAGLPLWVALARRIGRLRAWLAGMALSIAVFAWAATLGAGEVLPFAIICLLSGVALGADLTLPAALLAELLNGAEGRAARLRSGACFGWWNFVTKANLALAAGVALPLLAALGYQPSARDAGALRALTLIYALAPVVLKLLAMAMLWRWRDSIEPRPASILSGPLAGANPP
jgi:Na+/melibiose symporter-like transporter